jgi:hypothetical protein
MNESTNKKGAALIYVVLLSAMIIILGMGLINVSSSSYELSVEETKYEQAYLSSKSGLNFFLNALKVKSNNELQSLLDDVNDKGSLETGDIDVNNEVGDISIKLTRDNDYKFRIDSTSKVNGVNATTTAYLERTSSLLGFDFEDKPFYYYDSYSGGDKDGKFGSYKYNTKYKNNGTIQSKFGSIGLDEDDQFSKIDENQEVILTDSIKGAIEKLRLDDNSIPEPGVSGCILKNSSLGYSDNPYANDIQYINCTINKNTIDQTLVYGRDDYEVDFDLLYYKNNNNYLTHQVLIYIEDLSFLDDYNEKLIINGFNFYSQDVVYLSLANPNDLNRIVIVDEDSKLSYKFKANSTKLQTNGNSKKESFKYTGGKVFDEFNPESSAAGGFVEEPQGPSFFNDKLFKDNGMQLVYDVDGQNSNNFVILIDNVDEAYKNDVKELTLNKYNGQQLDAWIYAPEYKINIEKDFELNGGVIANIINVDKDSKILGITPNQGFLDLIKSDYVDTSWRVVYE